MRVENFTVTALSWSKEEIDILLQNSTDALKDYISGVDKDNQLNIAITSTKKLYTLLETLHLLTPSALAKETYEVLKRIESNQINADKTNALIFIIESLLQLPNYLEYLSTGSKDIPSICLPLINNLRSLYISKENDILENVNIGDTSLKDIDFKNVDLKDSNLFVTPSPTNPQLFGFEVLDEQLAYNFNFNNPDFDKNLDNFLKDTKELSIQSNILIKSWIKSEDNRQSSIALKDIFSKAYKIMPVNSLRILFWVVSGVFDGIANNQIKVDEDVKKALLSCTNMLKVLSNEGPYALNEDKFIIKTHPFLTNLNLDESIGDRQLQTLLFAILNYKKDENDILQTYLNQYGNNIEISEFEVKNIYNAFNLYEYALDDKSVKLASQIMSGKNKDVLKVVSDNIKEELYSINDKLDLHIRSKKSSNNMSLDDSVNYLGSTVEKLHFLAEVLSLIDLPQCREDIHQQKNIIESIILGDIKDSKNIDDSILSVAANLLVVESKINQKIAEISSGEGASAQMQELRDVLISQSLKNLQVIKNLVVSVSQRKITSNSLDTFDDEDKLQFYPIPSLLEEIRGALIILSSQEAQPIVSSFRDYFTSIIKDFNPEKYPDSDDLKKIESQIKTSVDKKIIHFDNFYNSLSNNLKEWEPVIGKNDFEHIANIVLSLEYFIEALRDRQPNLKKIILHAQDSLMSLSPYLKMEDISISMQRNIDNIINNATQNIEQQQDQQQKQEQKTQITNIQDNNIDLALTSNFNGNDNDDNDDKNYVDNINTSLKSSKRQIIAFDGVLGVELDDDIQDIFLEELDEEILEIEKFLENIRKNKSDIASLEKIRKSFHTIKGSGRLIGAVTLGEIACAGEFVLNRILSNLSTMSPAIISFIEKGLDNFNLFKKSLQGQTLYWDVDGYMRWAIDLFEGKNSSFIPTIQRECKIEIGYFEKLLSENKNKSLEDKLFEDYIEQDNIPSLLPKQSKDQNSSFKENPSQEDIFPERASDDSFQEDDFGINLDMSDLDNDKVHDNIEEAINDFDESSQDLDLSISLAQLDELENNLDYSNDNNLNLSVNDQNPDSINISQTSSNDDENIFNDFDLDLDDSLLEIDLHIDESNNQNELIDLDEQFKSLDLDNNDNDNNYIDGFDLSDNLDDKKEKEEKNTNLEDYEHINESNLEENNENKDISWNVDEMSLMEDSVDVEEKENEEKPSPQRQYDFSNINFSLEPLDGEVDAKAHNEGEEKKNAFAFNDKPITENIFRSTSNNEKSSPSNNGVNNVVVDVENNQDNKDQKETQQNKEENILSREDMQKDEINSNLRDNQIVDEEENALSKEEISKLLFGDNSSLSNNKQPQENTSDILVSESYVNTNDLDKQTPPSTLNVDKKKEKETITSSYPFSLDFTHTPYDLASEGWSVHLNRLKEMQELLDDWIEKSQEYKDKNNSADQINDELLEKLKLFSLRKKMVLKKLNEEIIKVESKLVFSSSNAVRENKEQDRKDNTANTIESTNKNSINTPKASDIDVKPPSISNIKKQKDDNWPTLENVDELTKSPKAKKKSFFDLFKSEKKQSKVKAKNAKPNKSKKSEVVNQKAAHKKQMSNPNEDNWFDKIIKALIFWHS